MICMNDLINYINLCPRFKNMEIAHSYINYFYITFYVLDSCGHVKCNRFFKNVHVP